MAQGSRTQVQALFLILLLSGGECIRVQHEKGWRVVGRDVCSAKGMINEEKMMERYESKAQSVKLLAENIKDTCTKGCLRKTLVLSLRLKKMQSCMQLLPDIDQIPDGVQEALLKGENNLASVFQEAQSAMKSVMEKYDLFPRFTETPELVACKFDPMNLDVEKAATNDQEKPNLVISKQLFGESCSQSAKQEYMAKLPAASKKLMDKLMNRLPPVINGIQDMQDAQKTDDADEVAETVKSLNEITDELLKVPGDMDQNLDPDVAQSLDTIGTETALFQLLDESDDEQMPALLQLDEDGELEANGLVNFLMEQFFVLAVCVGAFLFMVLVVFIMSLAR